MRRAIAAAVIGSTIVGMSASQANAGITDRVERKVRKVALNRGVLAAYASCDRISPSAWTCRIENISPDNPTRYCTARKYGKRIYVGRIHY